MCTSSMPRSVMPLSPLPLLRLTPHRAPRIRTPRCEHAPTSGRRRPERLATNSRCNGLLQGICTSSRWARGAVAGSAQLQLGWPRPSSASRAQTKQLWPPYGLLWHPHIIEHLSHGRHPSSTSPDLLPKSCSLPKRHTFWVPRGRSSSGSLHDVNAGGSYMAGPKFD